MTLEETWAQSGMGDSIFNFDVLDEIHPTTIAGFGYCRLGLNIIIPSWFESDWPKEDRRTAKGENYLELAVSAKSATTCRLLIERGADVQANVGARQKGYIRVLAAALVKRSTGAFTDELDEIFRMLVREGKAPVNEKYSGGGYGSPLCAAIESGSLSPGRKLDVVKFLVEEGADVNLRMSPNPIPFLLNERGPPYRNKNGNEQVPVPLFQLGSAIQGIDLAILEQLNSIV